jgi:hypothetical protein
LLLRVVISELKRPLVQELEAKMREAETDSHEGKRKAESLWPIFKIHHQVGKRVISHIRVLCFRNPPCSGSGT